MRVSVFWTALMIMYFCPFSIISLWCLTIDADITCNSKKKKMQRNFINGLCKHLGVRAGSPEWDIFMWRNTLMLCCFPAWAAGGESGNPLEWQLRQPQGSRLQCVPGPFLLHAGESGLVTALCFARPWRQLVLASVFQGIPAFFLLKIQQPAFTSL